jgi:hypothetical protein
MNSGRLWRWSPTKESIVTLSISLKDLSCSQLCRYPALYLYLKICSVPLQNTTVTGSLIPPQRDLQFIRNGLRFLCNGLQFLRILAVRILSPDQGFFRPDSWLFGSSALSRLLPSSFLGCSELLFQRDFRRLQSPPGYVIVR